METETNAHNYSREFKDDAVQRCVTESRTVASVAAELAIPEKLLRRWVLQYRNAKPLTAAERAAELQRLREEQQRLLEEIAILRAVAMHGEKATK